MAYVPDEEYSEYERMKIQNILEDYIEQTPSGYGYMIGGKKKTLKLTKSGKARKRPKPSQWNLDVKAYAEKSGMSIPESASKLKGKTESARKTAIRNLKGTRKSPAKKAPAKKAPAKKKVYDEVTGRTVQQMCWQDYLGLVRETYPDVTYREISRIASQGYEALKQKGTECDTYYENRREQQLMKMSERTKAAQKRAKKDSYKILKQKMNKELDNLILAGYSPEEIVKRLCGELTDMYDMSSIKYRLPKKSVPSIEDIIQEVVSERIPEAPKFKAYKQMSSVAERKKEEQKVRERMAAMRAPEAPKFKAYKQMPSIAERKREEQKVRERMDSMRQARERDPDLEEQAEQMFEETADAIGSLPTPKPTQTKDELAIYYEILGLPRSATKTEVKKAWIKLTKLVHPDKNGNREEFERVQEAYGKLKGLGFFNYNNPYYYPY